jgi:hypothetical protein
MKATRGHGDRGTRGHANARVAAGSPRLRVPASPRLLGAVILIIALLAMPEIALACPSCSFGAETDSPMAKGMNNAIWFLLGVIGFVQIAFVALFISFWRRARYLRKRREQFHLIAGSGWGVSR